MAIRLEWMMRVNVSFVTPKLKGILCCIGIDFHKEIELDSEVEEFEE